MKKLKFYLEKADLPLNALAIGLQGFLMSIMDPDYAQCLHEQETNPYSTTVTADSKGQVWTVNLLTLEAQERLLPVLLSLEQIQLKSISAPIKVTKLEIYQLTEEELLDLFHSSCEEITFSMRLLSPTSFKSKGNYILFPTPRLIFQSLMQKYTRLMTKETEIDEELLNFLSDQAMVTSYDLKTNYYAVHGHKIPAFLGRLTIKVKGASTLRAYAKMLLKFGEYSGVGVKTSLGMGGMKLEEKRS